MNNLPKVVAQQRRGRAANPRLLDRKSDALPLSHRTTPCAYNYIIYPIFVQCYVMLHENGPFWMLAGAVLVFCTVTITVT